MSRFEGLYFKQQNENQTLSFIVGKSADDAFVQIITDGFSKVIHYSRNDYKKDAGIQLGDNAFGIDGIKLKIERDGISVHGQVAFFDLTALRYDIMGPFACLPMECRHKIISLYHRLSGSVAIYGRTYDFANGVGYIEGDSGTSFPKTYTWLQCNDFGGKESVFISVADIPFLGGSFTGCICVVYAAGREVRLATYLGAKVLENSREVIRIKQGKLLFEAFPGRKDGFELCAPNKGKMSRIIKECVSVEAAIRLTRDGVTIFEGYSKSASFECCL